MSPTEDRERIRMARHARQMAHRSVPLSQHPDDTFIWADDVTRWTWREVLNTAAAFVVMAAFFVLVMFGASFIGPTP